MTKEELERIKQAYLQGRAELVKEAEEYARDTYEMCSYQGLPYASDRRARQQAFLAGAESREKRITELEVTNKKISDECHKLVDSLEKKQKENAELKEAIKHFNPCSEWNDDVHDCEFRHYAMEYGSQLTKAKKIIKDLCGMVRELNKPNVQLTNVDYSLSEAERFIKE